MLQQSFLKKNQSRQILSHRRLQRNFKKLPKSLSLKHLLTWMKVQSPMRKYSLMMMKMMNKWKWLWISQLVKNRLKLHLLIKLVSSPKKVESQVSAGKQSIHSLSKSHISPNLPKAHGRQCLLMSNFMTQSSSQHASQWSTKSYSKKFQKTNLSLDRLRDYTSNVKAIRCHSTHPQPNRMLSSLASPLLWSMVQKLTLEGLTSMAQQKSLLNSSSWIAYQ